MLEERESSSDKLQSFQENCERSVEFDELVYPLT